MDFEREKLIQQLRSELKEYNKPVWNEKCDIYTKELKETFKMSMEGKGYEVDYENNEDFITCERASNEIKLICYYLIDGVQEKNEDFNGICVKCECKWHLKYSDGVSNGYVYIELINCNKSNVYEYLSKLNRKNVEDDVIESARKYLEELRQQDYEDEIEWEIKEDGRRFKDTKELVKEILKAIK